LLFSVKSFQLKNRIGHQLVYVVLTRGSLSYECVAHELRAVLDSIVFICVLCNDDGHQNTCSLLQCTVIDTLLQAMDTFWAGQSDRS